LSALLLAVVLATAVLHETNLRAKELLHSLSDYLHVGAVACS